jgi:hypothetical protein
MVESGPFATGELAAAFGRDEKIHEICASY